MGINAYIVYIALFLYIFISFLLAKDKLIFVINISFIVTFWSSFNVLSSYLFIFASDVGGNLLKTNPFNESTSSQGSQTENYNSYSNGNPQGGPNPPQGDSVLPSAATNDDNSEDRAWSKAGSSTNYDYGSGGYVDSDQFSGYDSEENVYHRGQENSEGYVSKSLKIFDKKKNARINSLDYSQRHAYHSPEVTGLKPGGNVMHEAVRVEHQIHGKIWKNFVEHWNDSIAPETPLVFKPSNDTTEINGKPLEGWTRFEKANALLFLEKGKFKSLTNEHLKTLIDKKMEENAAKPMNWTKAVAEEMHRVNRQ